jgi:hypothetical protein
MGSILLIGAIILALGVIVQTIIFRYATTRTVRLTTLLVAALVSLPLLALALIALLTDASDPAASMWALAVCGILVGFWFKSPFRMLQD